LYHNANNELSKNNYWLRINKLSLNYLKTKAMLLGNKKDNLEHNILITTGSHII